jgi:tRNA pseudouridine38-40 synthase
VEKRRYALLLCYEGRHFRGFQRQPGLPTVQDAVEGALAAAGLPARAEPGARTDAGVNALGQVVTFSARAELEPGALRAAVNAGAPEGLVCLGAARVAPSFHARASATLRRYVYLVGSPPPPEVAPFAWTLPDPRSFPDLTPGTRLDAEAMREALAAAVGRHDFAAFARPGEQRDTLRTVTRAAVIEASWAPLCAVVLEGRGFLRAMVRHLVGTAVAVGLGRAPPSRIAELIALRERYRGVRAPGWGLTLAAVVYPPEAEPRWG